MTPRTDVATSAMPARSQPIHPATTRKAVNSAAGSPISAIKVHLTNDMHQAPGGPCWRHGWDRLWSRQGMTAPAQSPCISAVTYLDSSAGTDLRLRRMLGYCVIPVIPRRNGLRELATRVRHLHHHLFSACGIHFPAPAKRARPAHRQGTAALRSL